MASVLGAATFERRGRTHSDPVPLAILDEDFFFSMVNTAAEKVFRDREDQLLGLSIREVIPEWPIQAWEEPIPESIGRFPFLQEIVWNILCLVHSLYLYPRRKVKHERR